MMTLILDYYILRIAYYMFMKVKYYEASNFF
jgi:hypothetical protein